MKANAYFICAASSEPHAHQHVYSRAGSDPIGAMWIRAFEAGCSKHVGLKEGLCVRVLVRKVVVCVSGLVPLAPCHGAVAPSVRSGRRLENCGDKMTK